MDTRLPQGADANACLIAAARAAWLALAQSTRTAFVAEALLAKHLPETKVITGTVDDVPYDRLAAFADDYRATQGRGS